MADSRKCLHFRRSGDSLVDRCSDRTNHWRSLKPFNNKVIWKRKIGYFSILIRTWPFNGATQRDHWTKQGLGPGRRDRKVDGFATALCPIRNDSKKRLCVKNWKGTGPTARIGNDCAAAIYQAKTASSKMARISLNRPLNGAIEWGHWKGRMNRAIERDNTKEGKERGRRECEGRDCEREEREGRKERKEGREEDYVFYSAETIWWDLRRATPQGFWRVHEKQTKACSKTKKNAKRFFPFQLKK